MPPSKKGKRYTTEEIESIVYQSVGAASGILWQTHPDAVFPSCEVISIVRQVLKEHGI